MRPKNVAGRAHRLIAHCPAGLETPADAYDIISAAIDARAVVQVVAAAPNTTLEELCRRTRGSFQIAAPEDDLVRLLEDNYRILLARFLITYQAVAANADSLQVWVSNATGWGETTLAL